MFYIRSTHQQHLQTRKRR